MLKGHVEIELHNHNTGSRERIEQENMVTNALNYVIPNWVGGNRYPSEGIMPICQKALGGLMLFDGALTENKNNIFFPSEAHLIAAAGQGVNSTDPLRGSKNNAESKPVTNGYQTVWDFNTSQANGNIRSLALTMACGGDWMEPFYNYWCSTMHHIRRLNGDAQWSGCTPICYDEEKQEMYFFSTDGKSSSSVYDSNRRIYTYTFTATIYKEYIPTTGYKVADPVDRCDYPEAVTQVSFSIERWSDDPWPYFINGYDGYAYIIWTEQNTSGDGTFRYRKMKIDDYSFTLSDEIVVNVASCALRGGLPNAIINQGKAILRGYNSRWFYVVDLANPVNVRAVDLGEGWWSEVNYQLMNMRNGCVKFLITRNSTSPSRYYFAMAILYPDGWVLTQAPYRESTYVSWSSEQTRARLITDRLIVWGCDYSSYSSLGFPVNNYLGTICNLAQAITKNAASSMKVIYTLRDVDE